HHNPPPFPTRRSSDLTGDMIDAQEAYRIGLVNQVVRAGDLLAAAEQTLRGILAMGPLAVRLALEAVDQGLEMTLDEGLLLEANQDRKSTRLNSSHVAI